jgi:hypothetical protein
MTERKWTPGPWDTAREVNWIWVGPLSWSTRVCRVVVYDGEEVQQTANAHLIAAAPDLYEALELVLDAIGALSKPHELYGHGLDKDDIKGVFAALARARGE